MNKEELQKQILGSMKRFLPFHDCSICKYKCGFIVDPTAVQYDNGCHCVTYSGIRPSSWEEIFDIYNSQSEEHKGKLLAKWTMAE